MAICKENVMAKRKNLLKRGNVWYVRARVKGEIIYQSLATGDANIAATRAREIIAKAKAGRFDILDQTSAHNKFASLDDVAAIYERAARRRDLRERTVNENISALFRVLGAERGTGASTTLLTAKAVNDYIDSQLASRDDERARRSLASTLTQARSVFARWTVEDYRSLKLPDLSEFMAAGRLRKPPVHYRMPSEELRKSTLQAGRKLFASESEDERNLYTAFLLCFDLGLRSSEAVALKWDWFRKDDSGNIMLDIIRRPGYRPKGRERTIPVGVDVWTHLLARKLAQDEGEYCLPGGNPTNRSNLIKRDLAAWMRKQGWSAESYPKAAHELRKLAGARWYTELGAEVAQTWLGHVDVATTCRYYATLTRQPKALPMAT